MTPMQGMVQVSIMSRYLSAVIWRILGRAYRSYQQGSHEATVYSLLQDTSSASTPAMASANFRRTSDCVLTL